MIDYYGIQTSLRDLLANAGFTYPVNGVMVPLRTECVLIEAMDRELMNMGMMPLINVRLTEGATNIITIPNGYYAETQYEVDVVSYDLSEHRKAAKVRDDLLKAAMLKVRAVPNLNNNDVQTSKVGQNISFSVGTPEQGGGHIALATFRVLTESYVDLP